MALVNSLEEPETLKTVKSDSWLHQEEKKHDSTIYKEQHLKVSRNDVFRSSDSSASVVCVGNLGESECQSGVCPIVSM